MYRSTTEQSKKFTTDSKFIKKLIALAKEEEDPSKANWQSKINTIKNNMNQKSTLQPREEDTIPIVSMAHAQNTLNTTHLQEERRADL